MTQGTNNPVVAKNATTQNNQEWWMEELETEFPLPKILAFSRKGLKRDKLIAFIRKVSQKAFNDGMDCMDRVHKGSDAEYQRGREDALKECLDAVNMLAPLGRHGRKFRFRHNSERGTFSVEFA